MIVSRDSKFRPSTVSEMFNKDNLCGIFKVLDKSFLEEDNNKAHRKERNENLPTESKNERTILLPSKEGTIRVDHDDTQTNLVAEHKHPRQLTFEAIDEIVQDHINQPSSKTENLCSYISLIDLSNR